MYLTWLTELTKVLPKIAIVFAVGLSLYGLIFLLVKIVRFVRLMRLQHGFLEVTPPAQGDRSPLATKQLFSALHGIAQAGSMFEKAFGAPTLFTLEIESTKQSGIRYVLSAPKDKLSSLERTLHAYMPEVRIAKTSARRQLPTLRKIISFKQKKHYAFPLKTLENLDTHDPIGYLASAMANPSNDEHMVFQVLIQPIVSREAEGIADKILDNEDLLRSLQNRRVNKGKVLNVINSVLFGILDGVGNIYHGSSRNEYASSVRDYEYKKQVAKHLKPVRTLSYFEHELIESIHNKLSEPLFVTELRVCVAGKDKKLIKERIKNIKGALALFNVPKYQQLITNKVTDKLAKRWLAYQYERSLPGFSRQSIFSSLELANLYHFPNKQSGKTDNVITSLSKTLPAPVSLKNGQPLGVIIGENVHHGVSTPIGLTKAERERHMYIIGGTGNGKTTMLLYCIVQDIQKGEGVAVLDPHGDLAETILGYIPPERIHDVVYLNPDDLTHPIGINLLELAPGLEGDELLREKDLITESAISVLRKIFSEDDTGGHRIEYILRNAIQTALTLENPTLFTIFRLLNDTKYRQKIVRELEDNDLKIFWKNEIAKAGEMQKVKMSAGITSKIGRFLFSASAKRILEQEKSSINFEEILDGKKILICNFSKGLIGEDTSTLFGTTVLAKLQVAALKRARQKQKDRQPYYLYVDEFQNFATMSFVQMLSEARKYKLFLTMAEQSTQQQQQQRLVDIILANVGTVICFRSGSPADERLVLPLFQPYVEQGEIANLPTYNFYMRIAGVEAKEPLSGNTLLLDEQPDEETTRNVIKYSREAYGKQPGEQAKIKDKEIIKIDTAPEKPKPAGQRPSSSDQFAVARE